MTTVITRYQINQLLYDGTRTLVYRGFKTEDSKPVVLKKLRKEYPTFNELLQFRHQYVLSKNLEGPGIVKPIALEKSGNGYVLVMEDVGGVSLSEYVGDRPQDIGEFLQVAIAITKILEDLYRNRVIHKDIKPANILINPETKEIYLIDFSISSLLPRETQEIQNPNILEGTLAYISPEQTGRMNRGIDYRSDFYSLGVTFYQLLTGELPFQSDDPMELVHCHIAKMPTALGKRQEAGGKRGEEIPGVLSDIVFKLMAKSAEDRYQSAIGIKHDLEKCWQQWQETGSIAFFELGERDISDRFLIPEKLYGREHEVQTLLDAFERVAKGDSEMMLVAGFSGIGKTAVVNEVHKPIVRERGYFIKGKFDQFNRNIPFSALVIAFRDLMGQLLGSTDVELQQWKEKILAAVGENGQVLIEVIPELEAIVGEQPSVPELSGTAAQNRFNLLFEKFITVFTTQEHPLTLFLDDLQWADSASLNLMKVLMGDTRTGYLLVLGAYRDNEVFPAHPLMLCLGELEKQQTTISTITLAPLSVGNINQLVAETLSCSVELAAPLTDLVYQNTKGNPFFSNQLLKGLHEDGLITFNQNLGYWQCDLVRVREATLTDDVVEFMAGRLHKLPEATQNVLKLAACIGNQFDLETLGIICEMPSEDAAADLWSALREGLVLPQSETYKFFQGWEKDEGRAEGISVGYRFLHDRVQQAAYSLIPEDQKQNTHYHIGQLLLQQSSTKEQEERLFEIVNHLNIGIALISQTKEREDLAQLNLRAGQKAKTATAYSAAIEFLTVGIELLGVNCWQKYYDLSLTLHSEIAEASYLNTNFEQMEKWVDVVLQQAKTFFDTVKVQQTRILGAKVQGQLVDSLEIGLQVLNQLGIELEQQPTQEDIGKAYEASRKLWIDTPPQSLINLSTMSDPHLLAAMNVLTDLTPCAYMVSPGLMPLLIFKQIELSIISGNAPSSIVSYSDYGLVLCAIMGDISNGYEFGELALNLLEKFQAKSFKGRCWHVVHWFIKHWKKPLSDVSPKLEAAYEACLETGDLETLGLSATSYCIDSYYQGQNLAQVVEKIAAYHQIIIQYKLAICLPLQEIYQQTVLNLLGRAEIPYRLTGEIFNPEKSLPLLQASNQRMALFFYFLNQSILDYIFAKNHEAIQASARAAEYLGDCMGTFPFVLHFYFDALIQIAQYSQATPQENQSILLKVEQNQEKLHHWATLCPANHQHRWELVEAERCRVLGNKPDAMEAYDRAIAGAKENEYIQDEGLANELFAKFYLDWGREKEAAVYMQEAYYCYARWGAKAKIEDLETRYPHLLTPILQQQRQGSLTTTNLASMTRETLSKTTTGTGDMLDLATLMKASRTLSENIELEGAIANLIQVAKENAGAETVALMLFQEEVLILSALVCGEEAPQIDPIPVETSNAVPKSIVNKVKRTQEAIALDNASQENAYAKDAYIQQHQPQSILCLPLVDRGQLIGVLYLENNRVAGAFTGDRLEVLTLLCSQAAISLENARLYQESRNYAQQLEQTQLQLVQSEKMATVGQLTAGVAHEINNPVGFISGNLTYAADYIQDMINLLNLYRQTFPQPGEKIEEEIEAIELDYLIEDLPETLDSMKEGINRITEISKSMRTFSRADTKAKIVFNIHDGIDSTLLILKHRLKANQNRPEIEIVKNYGELPEVNCYPGQLNQVFMNLIANAIDAFDEGNVGRTFDEIKAAPNRIAITTEIESEKQVAIVKIKDNGMGMSKEVKEKVFQHLFTTKGVGKGTGLGLSISRQIIEEKHGGQITLTSEVGEGAEFAIALPLT